MSLHSLQLQIAMRGAALLAPGGIMAYSTCTFNPLENEAVVAELLVRCKGSVELVDTSKMLPGLKRNPGLSTWSVVDPGSCNLKQAGGGVRVYKTYADSQAPSVPRGLRKRFRPTMWPSAEKSQGLPLHHCFRMLPHHQDTGAFFIALLRKVKPALPSGAGGGGADAGDREEEEEEEDGVDEGADCIPGVQQQQQQQSKKSKSKESKAAVESLIDRKSEAGRMYLPLQESIRSTISDMFGLDGAFKSQWGCLFVRSLTGAGGGVSFIDPELR